MSKRIDIGSVDGIDRAIAYIQDHLTGDAIKKRLNKAFGSLMEEAANIANETYGDSAYAVVTSSEYPTYTLTAKSDTNIAFVEFGVGWGVNARNEFAHAEGSPDVHVGSWSKENGGQFWASNLTFWMHDKVKYTGHEEQFKAKPGMEAARQYVVDNWEKRVREVFSVD